METACGTGSYLAAVRDRYRMTGLDNAEAMLAVSRKTNPGVPHVLADMAVFTPEQVAASALPATRGVFSSGVTGSARTFPTDSRRDLPVRHLKRSRG